MQIVKRMLAQMNRCYAVANMEIRGERRLLVATEGEGPCLAFSGPGYGTQETVWEGPGGTMSMVEIPGTGGCFLAVQKFFRMFQWEEAKVVWVTPQADGSYEIHDVLRLPYIHRFDILRGGDRLFFLGCTLAEKKESKDDWSQPGGMHVAELDLTTRGLKALTLLKDGMTQNHGYTRTVIDGRDTGLATCREGVFAVTPPQSPDGVWQVRQWMDRPVSDVAALDIDGDGELELATIEAFHGDRFRVYKKRDGRFEPVFEHPETTEFYHVVKPAVLAGEPVFIGGCRRGLQQLFYVRVAERAPLRLEAVLIEEGVGPSNVDVFHEAGCDCILSANREKAEAALYVVTP